MVKWSARMGFLLRTFVLELRARDCVLEVLGSKVLMFADCPLGLVEHCVQTRWGLVGWYSGTRSHEFEQREHTKWPHLLQ